MDAEQKLMAAYQIEHREHLEGIRALLGDLLAADESAARESLDEIFRRVHTLKGGARVCGLQPVEAIAHQLETDFAQIRAGERAA